MHSDMSWNESGDSHLSLSNGLIDMNCAIVVFEQNLENPKKAIISKPLYVTKIDWKTQAAPLKNYETTTIIHFQ